MCVPCRFGYQFISIFSSIFLFTYFFVYLINYILLLYNIIMNTCIDMLHIYRLALYTSPLMYIHIVQVNCVYHHSKRSIVTCVYQRACANKYSYVCVCVCVCDNGYVYLFACVCSYVCVCMFVCVCVQY